MVDTNFDGQDIGSTPNWPFLFNHPFMDGMLCWMTISSPPFEINVFKTYHEFGITVTYNELRHFVMFQLYIFHKTMPKVFGIKLFLKKNLSQGKTPPYMFYLTHRSQGIIYNKDF
jgi:hypothetical protein